MPMKIKSFQRKIATFSSGITDKNEYFSNDKPRQRTVPCPMGSSCCILIDNMADLEEYTMLLESILTLAQHEVAILGNGGSSRWNMNQLNHVVIPEMKELIQHMGQGELFLKYGNVRSQRLLESVYLITDSLEMLGSTSLGFQIEKLQTKIYNQ